MSQARYVAQLILHGALGSIFLGCGEKTLDLGRNVEPPEYAPPDPSDGNGMSDVPTWVATHQYGGDALLLDETRVYWSTSGAAPRAAPQEDFATCWTCEESFVLRSCVKSDCARTLVTYWRSPTFRVQVGVNRTGIYWTETKLGQGIAAILTCPIAGCIGRPAIVISGVSSWALVVDDSYVYWLSTNSVLFKCDVNGCNQNPTIVGRAFNAGGTAPGVLAASATNLYWIDMTTGTSLTGAIMTIPKDGSEPPRVIADGLHRPQSLAVDAENVYFTESYSFGTVKRCPLAGCVGEPTVIASAQRYPTLLGVSGDRAYWFTFSNGPPTFSQGESGAFAQLVGCPISGCGPNPTVLMGDDTGPRGVGVDATHVYWTRYGKSVPGPNGFYNDGAVMRVRPGQ